MKAEESPPNQHHGGRCQVSGVRETAAPGMQGPSYTVCACCAALQACWPEGSDRRDRLIKVLQDLASWKRIKRRESLTFHPPPFWVSILCLAVLVAHHAAELHSAPRLVTIMRTVGTIALLRPHSPPHRLNYQSGAACAVVGYFVLVSSCGPT